MLYYNQEQHEKIEGTILFLGDSITDDGKYVSFLNLYTKLYFPDANISIRNLGVSSETVSGLSEATHPFPRPCLLNRLSRILEEIQPNWVFMFYGINDGIYYPFSQSNFQCFQDGYRNAINTIHAFGAKVIVLTPPRFDKQSAQTQYRKALPSAQQKEATCCDLPFVEYDTVMQRYGRWIMDELSSEVEAVVDVHTALESERAAVRATNPKFTSSDGIHPDRQGHWHIAQTILRELFGIDSESFESLMKKDHYKLFRMLYARDLLQHNYDKETIGHDNLYKATYLPKSKLAVRTQRLNKRINNYIKRHKNLVEEHKKWHGFCQHVFYFEGCKATVVAPKKAAANNPWIWRTEFFDAFASADLAMVQKGYHLVYLSIPQQFGCPYAVQRMQRFHTFIQKQFALNNKSILFGFSRGGLYALHYAAVAQKHVAAIYLDAPVVDIRSWPGGYGASSGSASDWERCLQLFSLEKETADAYAPMMEEALHAIVREKIPLVLVAGDQDDIVPYDENGLLVADVWMEESAPFHLILKSGANHHPHSLKNPTEIVSFLLKNANFD